MIDRWPAVGWDLNIGGPVVSLYAFCFLLSEFESCCSQPAYTFYIKCLWEGEKYTKRGIEVSVTRLGDLLDFGKLFKAFGNN